MRYEFLEHTADKKFKAFGSSIDEAFSNAVLATTATMIEPESIAPKLRKKISLKADNMTQLLYDLVDELIFLMDTEGFITGNVVKLIILKADKTEKVELSATLEGDEVSNYEIGGDVKSPTYNQMEIHEEEPIFVQMVLDI